MKNIIRLIISVVCLLFIASPGKSNIQSSTGQEEILRLRCTSDLYSTAEGWAKEYEKSHDGVAISVDMIITGGAEEDNEGLLIAGQLDYETNDALPAWKVLIGHNVIVPVISSKNPYIKDLQTSGVKIENLRQLISAEAPQEWGDLLITESHMPINLYIIDANTVRAVIGNFSDDPTLASGNINWIPAKKTIDVLRNDPNAIVFSDLGMLLDTEDHELISGMSFLPIDRNSNDHIDYMENIYKDANAMLRGVWIGKYPKVLVNNLYIQSESMPSGSNELAFLEWALNDGQEQLDRYGYSSLVSSERLRQLAQLRPAQPLFTSVPETINTAELIIYILLGMIVIITIYMIASNRLGRVKTPVVRTIPEPAGSLSDDNVSTPSGLHYDRTHTWAFMEMDGCVKVGMDDFLQKITGKITRLKMKDKGEIVKRGEPFLSVIQRGKQLTLYAPVSGRVRKANPKLYWDSSLVNTSPFGDGWVYMIEPNNWPEEVKHLQNSSRYRDWLKKEFVRMKDFLGAVMSNKNLDMSMIIIQDGGAIRSDVLADLGPEVWADFQEYFLDLSK